MIYENDCLFLFKKDVCEDLRDTVGIKEVDIRYMDPPNKDGFKKMINDANLIVYIDTTNRHIKFIGGHKIGGKSGNIEKY